MPLPGGRRIFMAPSSSDPVPADPQRVDPLQSRPVPSLLSMDPLRVDVVYAPRPDAGGADGVTAGGVPAAVAHPLVVTLELVPGATIGDAVLASGLLQHLPGVPIEALDLGVFNRAATAERLLEQGDRVEIYRPLQIDPKAARHLRVAARRKAEARARGAASGAVSGAAPAVPSGGNAAAVAGSDPVG